MTASAGPSVAAPAGLSRVAPAASLTAWAVLSARSAPGHRAVLAPARAPWAKRKRRRARRKRRRATRRARASIWPPTRPVRPPRARRFRCHLSGRVDERLDVPLTQTNTLQPSGRGNTLPFGFAVALTWAGGLRRT